MNSTFRNRVFTPIVLPVTLLGGLLLFAGSLSRVMLAVDKNVSVIVAVGASAYVLLVGFVIERNRRIGATALGAGLVLALVGAVGAGAIAQSVGIREIEPHGEEVAAEGGEAAGPVIPPDALVWGADNSLVYTSAPSTATAGVLAIAIDNAGGLEHNVVIEGVNNDQPIVNAANGIDVGEVELTPGVYTYYCSIPGHRAAGMEGTLTVE